MLSIAVGHIDFLVWNAMLMEGEAPLPSQYGTWLLNPGFWLMSGKYFFFLGVYWQTIQPLAFELRNLWALFRNVYGDPREIFQAFSVLGTEGWWLLQLGFQIWKRSAEAMYSDPSMNTHLSLPLLAM